MAQSDDGVRQVRLRCPETERWRTYRLDTALEVSVVQRLNDLAFVHGAEIVSMCAGHEEPPVGILDLPATLGERSFAEVRFAVFFPSWHRLAAQQARTASSCSREQAPVRTRSSRPSTSPTLIEGPGCRGNAATGDRWSPCDMLGQRSRRRPWPKSGGTAS